jgi:hypothetical protein
MTRTQALCGSESIEPCSTTNAMPASANQANRLATRLRLLERVTS